MLLFQRRLLAPNFYALLPLQTWYNFSFQFLVPHPYKPHPIPYFQFCPLLWPFLMPSSFCSCCPLLPVPPVPCPSSSRCACCVAVGSPASSTCCTSCPLATLSSDTGTRLPLPVFAAIQPCSHLPLFLHDAVHLPPLPLQLFFLLHDHQLYPLWGRGRCAPPIIAIREVNLSFRLLISMYCFSCTPGFRFRHQLHVPCLP